MALMKRAAAACLAFVLVVGTLVGVHGFVHAIRDRNATVSFGSNERPLVRFNATRGRRSATRASQQQPWALDESPDPFGLTFASNFESNANDEFFPGPLQQTGGAKPAGGPSAPAPMPLAPPTNAVPLPPVTDDWPLPGDVPNPDFQSGGPMPPSPRQRSRSGRRLIDKELPNSSAEERDLWHETMKDVPLNDLRELLRLRAQLGRLSPPLGEVVRPGSKPTLLPPGSPTVEAGPIYPIPRNRNSSSVVEPDPGRLLSESLAAIAKARQVILHNIANAQTNGYKRRLISFESVADQPMTSTAADDPFRVSLGTSIDGGARLAPVTTDMSVGKLVRTNRPLDLAIDGQGFFHVTETQKRRDKFTRRGRFTTNATGQLALAAAGEAWILQPPLTVPADTSGIEVGSDGQVRGWDAGKRSLVPLGRIQTAGFAAPNALEATDGTLFIPSPGMPPDIQSPGAVGHGTVRQGCLEESNVDLKQEFEELERLAGEVQALEQASRMLQPGGLDRPPGPADASSLAPRTGLP